MLLRAARCARRSRRWLMMLSRAPGLRLVCPWSAPVRRVHRLLPGPRAADGASNGAAPVAGTHASDAGPGDLDARLRKLTTQTPVVLFMKGDRDEPRCGFSRKVVEALNGTGLEYSTFDILQDEDVRQGLKTFSNWPTYPQLYAGGELLGGCDIVLEMAAGGELKAALGA